MTKTRIRYLIASLIGIAVGSFFGPQADIHGGPG